MRLGRIRLRNFKCFDDVRLDLGSISQACVSGDNGSGKSTLIVDAPLWCLFGKAHADLDGVVGPYGDTATVDLEVLGVSDTGYYIVTRTRKRGASSGLVIKHVGDTGKVEPVTSGVNQSEDFILDHILKGRTYDELIASVYMVQGKHSTFTNASQAEAKDIFVHLMALDRWILRGARVKSRMSELALEGVGLESKLNSLPTVWLASEKELNAKRAEVAAGEATMQSIYAEIAKVRTSLEDVQGNNDRYRAKLHQVEQLVEDTEALLDSIAAAKHELEGLPEPKMTFAEAEARVDAMTQAKHQAELWDNRQSYLHTTLAKYEQEIGELKLAKEQGFCGTCGQRFIQPDAERHVTNQLNVMLSSKEADEASLKKLGERPSFDEQEFADAQAELEIVTAVEMLTGEVERRQQEYDALASQLTNARDELTFLKELDADELNAKNAQLHDDLGKLHSVLEDAKRFVIEQELAAKTYEEAQRTRAEIEPRIKELTTELAILDSAQKAFSRDGIPAYVMDAALPQVEDTANELLSLMSEGRLSVRLSTTRLTKTAGMKDALDILVSDGVSERPFSTYSGGEGFRINFALRVALAELVAQRSGLNLSMLVVDEPEGLDGTGRRALVDALGVVSPRFDTIVLVSHHDDLREALPQTVLVRRGERSSLVTVSE